MRHTPLYDAHIAAGAKMVNFGGWEMPINYGSQLDEHHQVRKNAGMFDVSHMTVVDIRGSQARTFLSNLLANDVAKLKVPGKALYSCMLNQRGGVIDDLITYYMSEDWFRMVVNAATRDKDIAWLERQGERYDITITEHPELAMIAVQGPQARALTMGLLEGTDAEQAESLKPFSAAQLGGLFVARTGYTGEDGFEISLAAEAAEGFWNRLLEAGVVPCGLGARDSLRLEAGMNLYGQDMDEEQSPLESGLAWTVAMKDDRAFIGRAALEQQQAEGLGFKLVGLVLEGRGILRSHQQVFTAEGEGETTSGGFSPTLQKAIAFARIPATADGQCEVEIRGKRIAARTVQVPFVRNGETCDGIL